MIRGRRGVKRYREKGREREERRTENSERKRKPDQKGEIVKSPRHSDLAVVYHLPPMSQSANGISQRFSVDSWRFSKPWLNYDHVYGRNA
ncbi:hypothetical protein EVAR_59686_1 [Eumeta japonica]|uniref:Uncharacterized protein n=1 Tax=Eumeta variegata TaxID=151549 RepID=A0A4C1Z2N8_EUMVA|nr:hypothetical protein EVAR_59686_1 [Eumeta japonica]